MNFYALSSRSTITQKLKDHSANTDWYHAYDTDLAAVSASIVAEDPVLQLLRNKFRTMITFMKMRPNTFYHWHRDSDRKCALNILLDEYDSRTIFTKATELSQMSEIEELVYVKDGMYLLDVSKYHAVANFNNERIVFTMSFIRIDFGEVCDFCIQQGI